MSVQVSDPRDSRFEASRVTMGTEYAVDRIREKIRWYGDVRIRPSEPSLEGTTRSRSADHRPNTVT